MGARDLLRLEVLPDVELGEVGQREDAQVLPLANARIEERPELRTLVLRVPLAKLVAHAHDALLGASPVFVAPAATESDVEAVLRERIEERHALERRYVMRAGREGRHRAPSVDRLLHARDEERLAQRAEMRVAKRDDLGEVVPSIDVHHGERAPCRREGFSREMQEEDRVLSGGEQKTLRSRVETASRITNTASSSSADRLRLRRGIRPPLRAPHNPLAPLVTSSSIRDICSL